jgi:hypothetical protein
VARSLALDSWQRLPELRDLASEALHGLSDEESVDVFERCQLALEHVIKRLKQDQDEDQGFREAMQKLTEKAAKKKSPSK